MITEGRGQQRVLDSLSHLLINEQTARFLPLCFLNHHVFSLFADLSRRPMIFQAPPLCFGATAVNPLTFTVNAPHFSPTLLTYTGNVSISGIGSQTLTDCF